MYQILIFDTAQLIIIIHDQQVSLEIRILDTHHVPWYVYFDLILTKNFITRGHRFNYPIHPEG